MFNAPFVLLTLLVYIAPSFVGHMLSVDDALIMFFMRDKVVIFLVTCLVIKELPAKSPFTRGFCVLILIASVVYVVNFMAIEATEESFYNWVSEKDNG